MTARWLGLNLEDYAGVDLPYADADDIPSWDYTAIQALHTLGILEGSTGSDGQPYIHARSSITRAQAHDHSGTGPGEGISPGRPV